MAEGLAGGTLTVLLAGWLTTGTVVEVGVGARVVEEGTAEAVPGIH